MLFKIWRLGEANNVYYGRCIHVNGEWNKGPTTKRLQ